MDSPVIQTRKILDVVHSFHDHRTRVSQGSCRVRVFGGPKENIVLLTDLGEKGTGQSVTNAVELIAKSLIDQGLVIEPVIFIEHYERDASNSDTFDKVTLSPRTSWTKMSRDDVLILIGQNSGELNERSLQNPRILTQADQLLYQKDPFMGSRPPESNEIIRRRIEIVEGMVSKQEIEQLVSSGCNEQELQRTLKRDLSLFGEIYSSPSDEYICFSEYPLGDGAIDAVVFTGRSRMDIILIEIKGADFNLTNSDHYGEFNHKINQAAGQIRSRLGAIYKNMDSFRKRAHEIREAAEQNSDIYNAFLGPRSKLQVDPAKEVNIRTVIIGGRTRDDYEESRKRHEYESHFTPSIRLESWDTWLRRLRRV